MTPVILLIETSQRGCLVAVASEKEVLFSLEEQDAQRSNAAVIGGFCQKAYEFATSSDRELVAIAVTEGPGSYTGLRIGASMAKGLAFADRTPLIALPTLQIIAYEFVSTHQTLASQSDQVAVAIPASKEDHYVQIFSQDALSGEPAFSASFSPSFVEEYQKEHPDSKILFLGDLGENRAISEIEFNFVPTNIKPLPMSGLAWNYYKRSLFADLAYWQPAYVKPYEARISKNKVLNR